jgi:hypothetical protein
MHATGVSRIAIVAALTAGVALDLDFAAWQRTGPLTAAEAIVGRPMTPVSGAGVARRTTRRVVRRTTIYIAALPAGCTTVVINGVSYHSCGGVYYEPYGTKYVVVEVE